MRSSRPFQWRGFVLVAVIVLGLGAASNVSANRGSDDPTSSAEAARETNVGKLQALVDSKGALGIFLDEDSGEYVVVVPASGTSTLVASDISQSGLAVRLESRDIDRTTIDRIGEALEALRPEIKGGYGFGFDPESGTVRLGAETPEIAFESVTRAFPGKITFSHAEFDTTSMASDPQPHSGGAYLNGTQSCTTGFTLDFNAGGRYMATAGHCEPNGTATNMGTAWREAAAFPYWDIELIKDHTYRPYIYDSFTYTRPVVNAVNPAVGVSYCHTGRTSGVVCGWILQSLNNTICYGSNYPPGACAHNLAAFTKSGGTVIQLGDSGGPFWFSYTSPLRAGIRGVISGRVNWPTGWVSYATQYQTFADYYVGHAALAP